MGVATKTSLTVLQITDSHLRKEPEGTLLGMNTRNSLDAILDLISENKEQPDLVLATGDIAQDASPEAYHCFEQKMLAFNCPIIWLAGNHDDRDVIRSSVSNKSTLLKTVIEKQWKLIFLDSTVKGKVYGELPAEELVYLRQELEKDQEKHVMICFHHHPVKIDCQWLDTIGLRNANELFELIDQFDHIKLVLWGHIHQEFDQVREGIRLLASPSTCVQFKPKTDKFAVDELAPGYRWLRLHEDGAIETRVERANHIHFEVDMTSKGY